jgi:hypothetical protein
MSCPSIISNFMICNFIIFLVFGLFLKLRL